MTESNLAPCVLLLEAMLMPMVCATVDAMIHAATCCFGQVVSVAALALKAVGTTPTPQKKKEKKYTHTHTRAHTDKLRLTN